MMTHLLAASLVLGAMLVLGPRAQERPEPSATSFSVDNATIAGMRDALDRRQVTSRQLVQQYLARIERYESQVNAAISINPRALEEADRLDRERRNRRVRGPLHGIPLALKDNIHADGMPTTGGALAFANLRPPYEATLTRNLRDAGAIIIAKTVLTELANWVAPNMPSGYSPVGGYGMNPYDPRPDPRANSSDGRAVMNTGGSSSGAGTAASFWAANIGTETSGSILSPSNQTMLVGIKPTVGRVSRYGVIPITADQDTAGPMARTVRDAAILLGVLEGPTPDPYDPAHAARRCPVPPRGDYTQYLDARALRGARIGIPRAYYYEPVSIPGVRGRAGGLSIDEREPMSAAIAALRAQGAEIVDPADIPSIVSTDPAANLLAWPVCSGPSDAKGADADCSTVFKYGMKRDFSRWLASLGGAAPVSTLAGLRAWNREHQAEGAIKYGQAQLDISDEMDVDGDRARYLADREKDLALAGRDGIDAALRAQDLDALLFPGASGAEIAAKPGYPTVIVPFGTVPNRASESLPAGFDPKRAPYGVSFTGTACSEPRLIQLAYAFEQATKRRTPPVLDEADAP